MPSGNVKVTARTVDLPNGRMDVVFTPDGYREVIRYRGRDVDVRDVDGVHLNVAGTAIAAKIVAAELRR